MYLTLFCDDPISGLYSNSNTAAVAFAAAVILRRAYYYS